MPIITVGGSPVGVGGQVLFIDSITETFDKADGPLGPVLSWDAASVFDHTHQWEVVGQQAQLAANEVGAFEALSIPTPNLASPNAEITARITSVTRGLGTASPEYVIDGGGILRAKLHSDGNNYRGYALGLGRSNIFLPPGHTWHLMVFLIRGVGDADILDIDIASLANVTLPGTLVAGMNGPNGYATFTHQGPGPALSITWADSTWTDGGAWLGGSAVLHDPADTASITLDDFTARSLD